MAKRGHDEGGLRKLHNRKTETWEISITLPPDPRTGERKRATRSVRGNEKEARAALTLWQADIITGDHVPPDRMTVAQLAERWLQDEAEPRVRTTTLALYADTIRVHIVPKLGAIRVQALTPADVHQWMARLGRSDVGARTRQLALMRLKQMLSWAVAMEWVRRNVAASISPPASERKEAKAMSHAELRDFLAAAKKDYYWPLWLVYATTGMRRGEGLGLRWQDVDLGRKRLAITQQVGLSKGEDGAVRVCIEQLKTKASIRALDLDEVTTAHLTERHAVQQNVQRQAVYWEPSDLVFCTRHGTPHNPNNLYPSFAAICEDAGLDPKAWSIHDLRHTHASHLILAGVPIIEVSKRLGHSNPAITLRVYAHMVNDHQGRAVAAIEAALFPGLAELEG